MTLGEWLDAMSAEDQRRDGERSGGGRRREGDYYGASRSDERILKSARAELDARERRSDSRADDVIDALGRWLDRSESSGRDRGDDRSDRLGATLDQIERRLEDIAGRIDDRLQARPAADLDARLADIGRRIDEAHAARRGDPHEQDRLARLESSLETLAKRLGERPSEAPVALNGPRRRLRSGAAAAAAQIRAHQLQLDEPLPPSAAAGPLEDRLAAIEDRLENAQAKAIQALAPAVDTMRSDIAALAAQLGRPQPSIDLSPMREQLDSLKNAVVGALTNRSDADSIRSEIASLARRLEQPRAAVDLSPLQSQIESLTERLNKPSIDLSPIHNELASLSARLSTPPAAPDLTPIEAQMAELRDALHVVARQGANLDPSRLLDGLESRIDAAGGRISKDVRGEIQVAIVELRKALDTHFAEHPADQLAQAARELGGQVDLSGAHPTLDRLESQISSLVGRFDRLDVGPSTMDSNQLERLAAEMRAMARDLDPSSAVAKLESQLSAIDAKIEDVKNRPLAPTGKGGAKADLSGIESMIRGLTERMEEARAEQTGPTQFEELQAQIRSVAEKLDRSDGAQSLSTIERAVSDLFTQIDSLRNDRNSSAEAVARQAAIDAAREVAGDVLRRASDLNASASHPQFEALAEDVSALRRTSDLIDRKTHETLDAIHLALEKIVERLGAVERDLAATPAPLPPAPMMMAEPAPAPAPKAKPAAPRVETPEPARPAAPTIDPGAPTARLTGRRQAAPASAEPAPSKPSLFSLKLPFLSRGASDETPVAAPAAQRKTKASADIAAATESGANPDSPLEPGSGRPQASTGRAAAPDAAAATKANFIAAARRAAQMATDETQAARAAAKAAPADAAEKPKSLLETRKKPILIGLAALLLAVIAMNVLTRTTSAPPAPAVKVEEKVSSIAPPPATAPITIPQTSAPAPLPQTAAPAAPAQVDPSPTGSIPSPADATPAPQPPQISPPVSIDLPAAISAPTLRAAALRGDPAAAYEVGVRLFDGRGVSRDPKLALKWFERAAGEGLAPAQFRVGNMYEKGLGAARDARLAKQWYLKAADKGNAKALHNLGVMIAEGGDGKPDYSAAADYFSKAAKLGVRDSQYNIAILLARGLGVPQSMGEAYTWLTIAAAQGDDEAAKKRDEIGARLSPDELAGAKAAAQAFKPTPNDRFANDVAGPEKGWDAQPPAAASPASAPAPKSKPKSEGAKI